jgi:hypothetical protein
MLVAAGTLILLDSFTRFAIKGLGTPAPVFPTRYLVITGAFGPEYENFCRGVSRWIPRFSPWPGHNEHG